MRMLEETRGGLEVVVGGSEGEGERKEISKLKCENVGR